MTTAPNYVALFGCNLRVARLRAGLKQADMAERAGISLMDVLFVEAGISALTIQTTEALSITVGSRLPTLLETAEGEFTSEGLPGVGLRKAGS